jgi:hypothetical protein
MKISKSRVEKFQAGGGFMSFQPLPIQPPQQQPPMQGGISQGQTEDNGGRILDDETFKSLLGKGVTNDVMAYDQQLQQAEREYARMPDIEKNTARGQRLRMTLRGDLGTINGLMRGKEQFDDSVTRAKDNNSLGEFAVTYRGMVVKDLTTGKLQEVSYDQYAKDLHSGDDRKYQALTNAQLINERENNPNLVGDTKSFEALNTGVGMSKVKDEVLQVLTAISSSGDKTTRNQYLNIQNQQAAQGAQKLLGNAINGVYDVTSTDGDTNNSQQVKAAMQSMWTNLSTNAKSVLRARAATMGAQGDDIEKQAQANAMSLLSSKQSDVQEHSLDSKYDNDMTIAQKGGRETEGLGPMEALISDSGMHNAVVINPGGSQQFTTMGTTVPGFFQDGKPTGMTSITNIGLIKGLTDPNSVYIGDQKIDPNKLDAVVYDGGKVSKIPMPYTTGANGATAPDLDMFSRLSKAKQEVAALPASAQTTAVKESIYAKNSIPTDGKGGYAIPEKNFLTFLGYTNERALDKGGDANSPTLTNESQTDDKKTVEAMYKSQYLYNGKDSNSGTEADRPDYQRHLNPMTWLANPNVLKGMVYIPVTNDNAGARAIDGNSLTIPKSETNPNYYNQQNAQNIAPPTMMQNLQPNTAYSIDNLNSGALTQK